MAKHTETTFDLPNILKRVGAIEHFIFFCACAIYANTLGHQFTQDDAIVIYDNHYVKRGLDGVMDILRTDSFSGFFEGEDKSSLVSGGRYRPLTMVLFALLYGLVGASPLAFHLLAVGLYGLLCVLLFKVLMRLSGPWPLGRQRYFALITTFIFLVHPIHTEVVANVKGLDETCSLLFSLLSLLAAISYVNTKRGISLGLMMLSLLAALLSKENAAAFVVIIPLVLFFALPKRKITTHSQIIAAMALVSVFIGYWILRTSIVGSSLGGTPDEMMNNPFIKIEDGRYLPFTTAERWASIIYGMGKYIQLLFFPHPLTHDYYPRHFGVVTFKDVAVWASIVMNAVLMAIAIMGVRRRSVISFCIIFFYITIGLMSNVLFPIGTHLSERFLFTPSLALALAGGYGLTQLGASPKFRKWTPGIILIVLILGSVKTMSRNNAWYDDLTLFTTDVKVSKNSAKVRNAAGGSLLAASFDISDPARKNMMISEAIVHLNEAIKIHPNYKEAHLLLGNGYSYLKDYDLSIKSYDNALTINPYYDQASENLLIVLREGARQAGSVDKDLKKAERYLKRVLALLPQDFQATALMGTVYGSSGDHFKAIEYYERAIKLKPEVASTYVNLGLAQYNAGLDEDAQINFAKAVQIDPKALDHIQQRN